MTEKIREAKLKAEALTDEELEEVTGGGEKYVVVAPKPNKKQEENQGIRNLTVFY